MNSNLSTLTGFGLGVVTLLVLWVSPIFEPAILSSRVVTDNPRLVEELEKTSFIRVKEVLRSDCGSFIINYHTDGYFPWDKETKIKALKELELPIPYSTSWGFSERWLR